MNRKTRMACIVLFTLLSAFVVTPVASAAEPVRNGNCDVGEVCFYYNSNLAGSISDMSYSLANYGTSPATCNHFIGPGNGKGKCIKNNTASAWNRTSSVARVYFSSNFNGDYQDFAPNERANLKPSLKNNNASHEVFAPSEIPWRCRTVNLEATSSALGLFHLHPTVNWCYNGRTVAQWGHDCSGDFVPEGFWFFQDCDSSTETAYELDGNSPGGIHFQIVGKWRSGYLITKTVKVDIWGRYDGTCGWSLPGYAINQC